MMAAERQGTVRVVRIAAEDDFDGWRDAARSLALAQAPPDRIVWRVGDDAGDLFADDMREAAEQRSQSLHVPRRFYDLARSVILHSDNRRFDLLYTLLLRVLERPGALGDRADPLVRQAEAMAKSVRRDIHKMRAFVRFREVEEDGDARYVAWFEPDHHIVRANAVFFRDRFTNMRWSILTPALSLHWDGETLHEGPGATAADAPAGDPTEAMWRTYYASIFNPARLNSSAMLKEMPRKYWKNMPETALIPALVATARQQETAMIDQARGQRGDNAEAAWESLREEAMACRRCPLYRPATQTVFGEGPVDADIMLIGEQPGDQEDVAGRPFVGPAGEVLDRALGDAGVDRARLYITNAVKHFKFTPRGKRRIHARPDTGEITACRWWLEQEMLLVRPKVIVALGATAARSLLGRSVTISRERGQAIALPDGAEGWITVHPSYLLRLPDPEAARAEYARFTDDLRNAAARARQSVEG